MRTSESREISGNVVGIELRSNKSTDTVRGRAGRSRARAQRRVIEVGPEASLGAGQKLG